MFTVIVTLDVREERLGEFIEGIRANATATLRDEPGCLRFDVHRSLDAPARFHFYEIYADRDAFELAHRSAPHYAAWRNVVARCVVPGSHSNLLASPEFPEDIPERIPA
jgi:autoinducer 2-degrading protein